MSRFGLENVWQIAATFLHQLEKTNEDAILTKEKMIEIGEAVKSIFDSLSDNRSNLLQIHLLIGISALIHS